MPTYTLTETEPTQHDDGVSIAHTYGEQVTTFETDGEWGYCYHGVSREGNSFESDDETGYDSEREALTYALESWLEESITQDELDAWDNAEESARLTRLRERIGFSHYHISGRFPGSVQVNW